MFTADSLLSIGVLLGGQALTLFISLKVFLARQDERAKALAKQEEADKIWRADVKDKLEKLLADKSNLVGRVNLIEGELDGVQAEILRLRQWRHEKADPYINNYDALHRRLERVEARNS
jgi:hypothetical protein